MQCTPKVNRHISYSFIQQNEDEIEKQNPYFVYQHVKMFSHNDDVSEYKCRN